MLLTSNVFFCSTRDIQLNQILEVMDFEKPIQNRLATVISILGDRIHVRYLDAAGVQCPKFFKKGSLKLARLHCVTPFNLF